MLSDSSDALQWSWKAHLMFDNEKSPTLCLTKHFLMYPYPALMPFFVIENLNISFIIQIIRLLFIEFAMGQAFQAVATHTSLCIFAKWDNPTNILLSIFRGICMKSEFHN